MERIGIKVRITANDIADMGKGKDIEVLVRRWEDGTVEADSRGTSGGVWLPVQINGGTVEEVEV